MFILPQRDREDVLPDSLLQVMPGVPPAVAQAMLEPRAEGHVCGRCTAFRDGYCTERLNVMVRPADPGCDLFLAS